MGAVTTYHLLPSIHAPIEGQQIQRIDGSTVLVVAPLTYVLGEDVWHVRASTNETMFVERVSANNGLTQWREVG